MFLVKVMWHTISEARLHKLSTKGRNRKMSPNFSRDLFLSLLLIGSKYAKKGFQDQIGKLQ